MKKMDVLYGVTVASISVAIIVVTLFKFVLNKEARIITVENPRKVTLMSTDERLINLVDLMENRDDFFVVIFGFEDCYSCISRGLSDLSALKKAGKNCAALVVYDYLDDIKGWSEKQEFSPIFMIKKSVYFENIKTPHLPVFIHFRKGEIEKYQFITAGM